MIPLRDVIPSRTTPYVTIAIIALNALIFLWEVALGRRAELVIFNLGLVPAGFLWLNVFTSMFVHAGWLHFGGNMLYLWIFGDNVEDRMGHGRFVAFYLLCGIAAALAQTAIAPTSTVPMVGASGAIAGVMGAYFLLYPKSRIVTLVPIIFIFQIMEVPAIWFLGIWFAMQFINGVGTLASTAVRNTGGVAFWAHLAGFVAGVAMVKIFTRPERQRVEWWDRKQDW